MANVWWLIFDTANLCSAGILVVVGLFVFPIVVVVAVVDDDDDDVDDTVVIVVVKADVVDDDLLLVDVFVVEVDDDDDGAESWFGSVRISLSDRLNNTSIFPNEFLFFIW